MVDISSSKCTLDREKYTLAKKNVSKTIKGVLRPSSSRANINFLVLMKKKNLNFWRSYRQSSNKKWIWTTVIKLPNNTKLTIKNSKNTVYIKKNYVTISVYMYFIPIWLLKETYVSNVHLSPSPSLLRSPTKLMILWRFSLQGKRTHCIQKNEKTKHFMVQPALERRCGDKCCRKVPSTNWQTLP